MAVWGEHLLILLKHHGIWKSVMGITEASGTSSKHHGTMMLWCFGGNPEFFFNALYMYRQSLRSILELTGNQCKSLSTEVMWSCVLVRVTKRATPLWTRCSRIKATCIHFFPPLFEVTQCNLVDLEVHVVPLELGGAKLPPDKVAVQHLLTPRGQRTGN